MAPEGIQPVVGQNIRIGHMPSRPKGKKGTKAPRGVGKRSSVRGGLRERGQNPVTWKASEVPVGNEYFTLREQWRKKWRWGARKGNTGMAYEVTLLMLESGI